MVMGIFIVSVTVINHNNRNYISENYYYTEQVKHILLLSKLMNYTHFNLITHAQESTAKQEVEEIIREFGIFNLLCNIKKIYYVCIYERIILITKVSSV